MMKPLTFRERRFVDELLLTTPPFNGTQAAIQAGYGKAGAAVEASRLLRKPKIQAAIAARKAQIEQQNDVSKDQFDQKVRRLFHGDVRKLFDEHGNPIDIPNLGDNEALMIEGFEVVEDFTTVKNQEEGTEHAVCTGSTKKIKYTKPREALEFVGKVLGYYVEKPKVDAHLTVEFLVGLIQTKAPKVLNEEAVRVPTHEHIPFTKGHRP